MIVGSLAHSERIEGLHPAFARVFAFIKEHDLLTAPLECITLDGDKLFINNVQSEGRQASSMPLEAHRQYLDIHVLLEGQERIGWRAIEDCGEPSKVYNEQEDYMLWEQPASSYIDLRPGQFAIVYPEDAHAPLIGQGCIRKLVVKALVNY